MNQLRPIQAVDRLSLRVVIAVSFAAHRRLDARLAHSSAVPDGRVLRFSVAVVGERIVTLRLARVQGFAPAHLVQSLLHGTAQLSTNDTSGKHVNNEGQIPSALLSRDIREVRYP